MIKKSIQKIQQIFQHRNLVNLINDQ